MFISRKEHKQALDDLRTELSREVHSLRKAYLRHLWCDKKWRYQCLNEDRGVSDIYSGEGEYGISLNCFNCGNTITLCIKSGVKWSSIIHEVACPRCGVKSPKKGK